MFTLFKNRELCQCWNNGVLSGNIVTGKLYLAL